MLASDAPQKHGRTRGAYAPVGWNFQYRRLGVVLGCSVCGRCAAGCAKNGSRSIRPRNFY
jgi:heterodisulfide reductase subunit C